MARVRIELTWLGAADAIPGSATAFMNVSFCWIESPGISTQPVREEKR
jgi:hypothetical protein